VLAQRFNGYDKVLLLPTKAPSLGIERKKCGRFSGLSAFQVVKTYVSKWRLTEYLLIIDMEHFGLHHDKVSIQNAIEDNVRSFGFADPKVTLLNEGAYRISCFLGSHRISMNAALSGSEKRVEENISKLIKLEYNTEIAPEKGDIESELHRLGLSLEELLRKSDLNNLSRAFPGLTAALKDFENHTTSS